MVSLMGEKCPSRLCQLGSMQCGERDSSGKQNEMSVMDRLTGDFLKRVWGEGEKDQLRKQWGMKT